MIDDTPKTKAERDANLAFWMIKAQMPRPGGVHIYSKGQMQANATFESLNGMFRITVSKNVNYSQYVLGYTLGGQRRTARGKLEQMNFRLIDNVVEMLKGVNKE